MYDFYHKLLCSNDLLVFIVSTNMTQNDNSYSWYASFLISVSHIIAIFSHDILYVEHVIVWNCLPKEGLISSKFETGVDRVF